MAAPPVPLQRLVADVGPLLADLYRSPSLPGALAVAVVRVNHWLMPQAVAMERREAEAAAAAASDSAGADGAAATAAAAASPAPAPAPAPTLVVIPDRIKFSVSLLAGIQITTAAVERLSPFLNDL